MRDVRLLVLTALAAEPMHGHRIRSEIEGLSGRPVGPGTLYGAINSLEDDGFIRPLVPEGRRKPYELTDPGRRHLAAEVATTRGLVDVAEKDSEVSRGQVDPQGASCGVSEASR